MNKADRERLESELPPGWKIITKISQVDIPTGDGTHYGKVTMQAESSIHNVVLEGTFDWIKRRATSYSMSARHGGI